MSIILVSGKKGSGKDTFYEIFSRKYGNCCQFSFADSVKKIVVDLSHFYLGIEMDKTMLNNQKYKETPIANNVAYVSGKVIPLTPRVAMQHIATDILRKYLGENIFAEKVACEINNYLTKIIDGYAIITDLRFVNEFDTIKRLCSKYHIITVNIDRELTNIDEHISENGMNNVSYTYTINNNGSLYDFENAIEKIMISSENSGYFPN